jgi:hypothetical protein
MLVAIGSFFHDIHDPDVAEVFLPGEIQVSAVRVLSS